MSVEDCPAFGLHLPSSLRADEAVRLARAAESTGFESVWISEDLYYRGAMPTAGAVAAATSSIAIGFGVLTPYNRHPSLIAMEAVSLMELADKRLLLGLGAGVAARIERMGLRQEKPLQVVRDTVALIRRLLSGEEVTTTGAIHRANALRLTADLPAAPPPVFLAATGPRSLAQVGAIGDGVVLTIMSSSEHIGWANRQVAAGAAAAGRSEKLPSVAYLPLAVAEDAGEARNRLKGFVAHFVQRWASIPALAVLFTEWGPLDPDELAALAKALDNGADPQVVITNRFVDTYCVAGTPGECLDRLAELGETGLTTAVFDKGNESVAELLIGIEKLRNHIGPKGN